MSKLKQSLIPILILAMAWGILSQNGNINSQAFVGDRPDEFCIPRNLINIPVTSSNLNMAKTQPALKTPPSFKSDQTIEKVTLTDQENQANVLNFKKKYDFRNGFQTEFEMEATHECAVAKTLGACSYFSLNGYAFFLHDSNDLYVGQLKSGIGYASTTSIAIEFDFSRSSDKNDKSEVHISFIPKFQNSADEADALASNTRPAVILKPAPAPKELKVLKNKVKIQYFNKNLRVLVNDQEMLGYFDTFTYEKLFPHTNTLRPAISAASAVKAGIFILNSWNMQLVGPSIPDSLVRLSNTKKLASAGEDFGIDILLKDSCKNNYILNVDFDKKEDLTLLDERNQKCYIRYVVETNQEEGGDKPLVEETFKLKVKCDTAGPKTLNFRYKGENLPPLSFEVKGGKFQNAKLDFFNSTVGNIDDGIYFDFYASDEYENPVETSEDEVRAKLKVIYPNSNNARPDSKSNLQVKKKVDGQYRIWFSSDIIGNYGFQDPVFIKSTANGKYDFYLEAGKFDPKNSYAKMLSGSYVTEAEINIGKSQPDDMSGKTFPAGTEASLILVFKDRFGNMLSSSRVLVELMENLMFLQGKGEVLAQPLKDTYTLYGNFKFTKAGQYSFSLKYMGFTLNCPNCNFQINPLAADLDYSSLYQFDAKNSAYSTEAKNDFSIQKGEKFNFKYVLKDMYDNVVEVSSVDAYKAKLSGNNMRELSLSLSKIENGLKLQVIDADFEYYSNLVGRKNYQISITDTQAAKNKNWLLEIISDGSDSDAGNGDFDGKATFNWMKPLPKEKALNLFMAGSTYRARLTLLTKENPPKRFNNWSDDIVVALDALNKDKGETLSNLQRGEKKGTYYIDVSMKVVTKTMNKLKFSWKGKPILLFPPTSENNFKVTPAQAFKAVIMSEHLKSDNDLVDGTVNRPYSFTIRFYDQFNNLQDVATPSIVFKSQEDTTIEVAVSTNKLDLGYYNCSITPTFPGKYSIESTFIKNAIPNTYYVYFRRGEPSPKTSFATIVEDVSLGKVAGSTLTFRITSLDESGLSLNKDEVLKALSKYGASVKEPGLDALTNIPLVDVDENGYINAKVTLTRAGLNSFSAALSGVAVSCKVCSVKIYPADVDLTKSILSLLEGTSETVLDLNTALMIDNIKKDPIFLMKFNDQYGNAREPAANLNFSGVLNVPKGAKSKYIFVVESWVTSMKAIKFTISNEDIKLFTSELKNEKAFAVFSAFAVPSGAKNDMNLKVILKGQGSDDDIYSNEDIDPNNVRVNPKSLSIVVGEFAYFDIELRDKDGKLYNHPLTFGWYNPLEGSFKLKTLGNDPLNFAILKSKMKGVYNFQLTSYKSYINGVDITISYMNPNDNTTFIEIPTKIKFFASPGPVNFMVVDNENVFVDTMAGERKAVDLFAYDLYQNLIPKLSFTALNIVITSTSKETLTPSFTQAADGKVTFTYVPTKIGEITISSLKFKNKNKKTVDSYRHKVISAVVSASRSIATLDLDSIPAGNSVIWKIYPRDQFDNPIDCSAKNIGQYNATRQEPDNSGLLPLKGVPSIKDEDVDYYYWTVQLTTAGTHEFKGYANGELIPSNKFRVTVEPIQADFNETTLGLYNSKTSRYDEYNGVYFDQDISSYPELKVILYDKYKNYVKKLDATFEFSLYFTNEELGNRNGIIFCRQNDKLTFKMCENNALQPELISPRKRWSDLIVPRNYSLLLRLGNIAHSPFKMYLKGNATDDDASNLPIDEQNTILTPESIKTEANVPASFQIFIMTTNKNLRRNEWFENPSEAIKLAFSQDNEKLRYTIEKGEKKGIYKATVYSNISYVTYLNKISASINGVKVQNKTVKLQVMPGSPDVVLPYNKKDARVLAEIGSVGVDDVFSQNFIAKDKWDNLIDLNSDTAGADSELTAPNGDILKHERFFPLESELMTVEFQPKVPGTYTIKFNSRSKYTFEVKQGKIDVAKSSANLSPPSVIAGQSVTIFITPRDKWGNTLSLTNLSDFQYFINTPKDNEDAYSIGTAQPRIVNGSVVVYEEVLTIKGFYRFKTSIQGTPVVMALTRVQVKPADVSLPNCILKYLDDITTKYELASKDSPIKEDNTKYEPKYLLFLADKYNNLYDTFPADYYDDFTVIFYGNDYLKTNPIRFLSSEIQGNSLYITIDGKDKTRYQSGIFKPTPYSLEITFLINKERVIYPIQLLGEGDGDKDAEIEKDIDISKTYLSKTELKFVAGKTDEFMIELRTESGKRKADIGIPQIEFFFKQADGLNDGNYSATFIKGDLRGRFIVTVTGYKSNELVGPTRLNMNVNKLVVPKTLNVTVTPADLDHIEVVQTSDTVSADVDYKFTVIPRDIYNNIPNVKPSQLNMIIDFPKGYVGAKEFSGLNDYSTNYINYVVKNRAAGEYAISSQFLKGIKKFTVIPGAPNAANTIVKVSPPVLPAGEIFTVEVTPYDSYNNLIKPLSTRGDECLKATSLVLVHSALGNRPKEFGVDQAKNVLNTTFSYNQVGMITVVVNVNSKQTVCDSCVVQVIPGQIYLPNTLFFSGSDQPSNSIQLNAGADLLSLTATLFDRYKNAIAKIETNEDFSMVLSGNNMDPMELLVTRDVNTSNLVSISLKPEQTKDFTRLVPRKGYELQFVYLFDGRRKADIKINLDILGQDDGGGNGPWVLENTYVSPLELEIKAGEKAKITVELRTSENKRFVGDFDINKFNVKEIGLVGDKLRFNWYFYDVNGRFLITFSSNVALGKGQSKKLQLTIDGKTLNQTVKVVITPGPPDVSKTIISQGLPFNLLTQVPVEVRLKLFDSYSNLYQLPDWSTKISGKALEGKATFGNTKFNDETKEYTIAITPSYPPRIISLQLFFTASPGFEYPILITPWMSEIRTTFDASKTELVGDKLSNIQIGNHLSFNVLLKDSFGYCYEPTLPLSVVLSGPFNTNDVNDKTLVAGATKIEFVIEGVPKVPAANDTSTQLTSNGYICNKFYNAFLYGNKIQKIGFYQIDVFAESNKKATLSQRLLKVIPGPAFLATSLISLVDVKITDVNSVGLKAFSPFVVRLYLRDSFKNNIQSAKGLKVDLSFPSDALTSKEYTLEVSNGENYIDYKLTLMKTGPLPPAKLTMGTDNAIWTYLDKINFPTSVNIIAGDCSTKVPNIQNTNLLSGASISAKTGFTIVCMDPLGNEVQRGGETFSIQIIGIDQANSKTEVIQSSVTDKGDGKYSVEFTPNFAGKYTVTIQLKGQAYGTFSFEAKGSACPANKPFICVNNNECVSNYKNCGYPELTCPDNNKPIKCLVNGKESCVTYSHECDCPSQDQVKCLSDNKCVDALFVDAMCSTGGQNPSLIACPGDYPIQCSDGGCRNSLSECPSPIGCPPQFKLCPDSSCVLKTKNCPDRTSEVCPFDKFYRCDDFSCAAEANQCPTRMTCPKAGQVVCPNRRCVDTELQCTSPPNCPQGTITCFDGSCSAKPENCPNGIVCPTGKALCFDGSCKDKCIQTTRLDRMLRMMSNTTMPCPESKIMCSFSEECVDSVSQCPQDVRCAEGEKLCNKFECVNGYKECPRRECPENFFLCWDNSCVDDLNECPTKVSCPDDFSVLCSDGACVKDIKDCKKSQPCPTSKPVKCGTGECRKSYDQCPTQITCPKTHKFKCQDGECVENKNLCNKKIPNLECNKNWVRCGDGSCAPSKGACPTMTTCLPGQVKCWNTFCADKLEDCKPIPGQQSSNPERRPVFCPNGDLATDIKFCPTQIVCPPEHPIRCEDGNCRSSIAACFSIPDCEEGWSRCPDGSCNAESCGTQVTCPTETPYKCFDGTCRELLEDCPEMVKCPIESPILCDDGSCVQSRMSCPGHSVCDISNPIKCPNGQCVSELSKCTKTSSCSNGRHLCDDGTCRKSASDCPIEKCPSVTPYKCDDGLCVSNPKFCDLKNGCPYTLPIKCKNGLCVSDLSSCPNNNVYACPNKDKNVLCPDGSCAAALTECPLANGCPLKKPQLCSNGNCINPNITQCSIAKCPPSTPVKCYNGLCVKSLKACSLIFNPEDDSHCLKNTDGNTIFCADGRCVSSLEHCKPVYACPTGTQRCPDGSCRLNLLSCPILENRCPEPNNLRCINGACVNDYAHCINSNGCPGDSVVCSRSSLCSPNEEACSKLESNIILNNGFSFSDLVNKDNQNKISEENQCKNGGEYCLKTGECSKDKCPIICPEGFTECQYDKLCKRSKEDCLNHNGCPLKKPFKCADGSCVDEISSCEKVMVCSEALPYLCADGTCVSDRRACRVVLPCPNEKPYRCPNKNCMASKTDCNKEKICPPSSPISCKNGGCVKNVDECQSSEVCQNNKMQCIDGTCKDFSSSCLSDQARSGKRMLGGNITVDNGCTEQRPFRCPDNSCRASCQIIKGCFLPSAPYRCQSGICAASNTTCQDNKLGACEDGKKRCEDGVCRIQCLPFDGCPLSAPYHCPNGKCSIDEEGCKENGLFTCIDNTQASRIIDCQPAVRNFRPEEFSITVSAFTKTEKFFIVDSKSSTRYGYIYIPTGAFKNNIDLDASPNSIVLIKPVADSYINNTKTELKDEWVKRLFPKLSASKFPSYSIVRSPIVKIEVQDRNNSAEYRFSSILGLGVDLFDGSSASQDYCLGLLNEAKKLWECASVNQLATDENDYENTILKFEFKKDGIYAVIYNPRMISTTIQNADESGCDWWCENKGTVLGVIFGFIGALLILGMILYLYLRLSRKGGDKEKLLDNAEDRKKLDQLQKDLSEKDKVLKATSSECNTTKEQNIALSHQIEELQKEINQLKSQGVQG